MDPEIKIEAPAEEIEQVEQIQELDPIADRAKGSGWVPKEEYTGDPAKWVDAAEFIRRGELFDKIEHQNKQVKELRKALDALKEHHSHVKETEYRRALAALRTEKKQALADGDVDTFFSLEEKEDLMKAERDALQSDPALTPSTEPAEDHPDFVSWKQRNTWYEKDADLRAFADGYGPSLRGTGTPEQILAKVAAKVREVFPDKFRSAAAGKPGAVVSGNGASRSGPGKYVPTDEERQVAKRFARTGVMSEEDYYKSLANMKKDA